MKSILITGANRGIGLGIVKELISSSSKPELIFAGYRDADKSKVMFTKVAYFC
jgi:NAD(P)-dependent dehydrogenase (short-subunit alcohol dehydrogenase family)